MTIHLENIHTKDFGCRYTSVSFYLNNLEILKNLSKLLNTLKAHLMVLHPF